MNPNRTKGVQLDAEIIIPFTHDGDALGTWDRAWTEHCVRRLYPGEKDTLLSMLGLGASEREPQPMKRCPMCKETRPKTEYYRAIARSDNLSTYCRQCHNIHIKASRKRRQRKES